jgi:hypothetical protein
MPPVVGVNIGPANAPLLDGYDDLIWFRFRYGSLDELHVLCAG